ncbi:hypothetical protein SNOG_08464 [Parastagonospora nodorum SN15]|uniref:Uncharacterized protein n=1 Tax=Phaeosphaeria nodorum (strain SN15 / ATCC MYA-4574 / FGSC 10173) TaxID=321614 RepID=Q0UIF0_PHANO|nr:hypothetical protein SNOG_08464 [Parastagonospora nodorum SN15]EAT84740.2 hypothetical protein SNOG_08464 [Parastagonospora nodorum SN15]
MVQPDNGQGPPRLKSLDTFSGLTASLKRKTMKTLTLTRNQSVRRTLTCYHCRVALLRPPCTSPRWNWTRTKRISTTTWRTTRTLRSLVFRHNHNHNHNHRLSSRSRRIRTTSRRLRHHQTQRYNSRRKRQSSQRPFTATSNKHA